MVQIEDTLLVMVAMLVLVVVAVAVVAGSAAAAAEAATADEAAEAVDLVVEIAVNVVSLVRDYSNILEIALAAEKGEGLWLSVMWAC